MFYLTQTQQKSYNTVLVSKNNGILSLYFEINDDFSLGINRKRLRFIMLLLNR